MTFIEAAIEILKREGKPLPAKELARLAIKLKLLSVVGRDPETTMQTRLQEEVRRPGADLTSASPGVFGLRNFPSRQTTKHKEPGPPAREQKMSAKEPAASKKRERPSAARAEVETEAPAKSRGRTTKKRVDEPSETPAAAPAPAKAAEAHEDEAPRRRRSGRGPAPAPAAAQPELPLTHKATPAKAPHLNPQPEPPAPVVEAVPVIEVKAAVVEAVPVIEAKAVEAVPVVEAKAAVVEAPPAPVVEAKAPVVEHKAPVVEHKAPAVEHKAPEVKAPVVETKAPEAKAPVVEAKAPEPKAPEARSAATPAPTSAEEAEAKEAQSRIMPVAEAVYDVLRGSSEGRPVHYRQITDIAIKRRLARGEAVDLSRLARAAVIRDLRQRDSDGLRPRIKSMGNGMYLAADRKLEPEVLKAETELSDRVNRTREATRVALRRRLRALPASAFELMMRLLLERIGMINGDLLKRGEGVAYYAGTLTRGSRNIKTLVAIRPSEGEVPREAIAELRAGMRLRGYDEGLVLTTGRLSAAAQAELTPGIDVYDQDPLTDLLIRHQVGVRRQLIPMDYLDTDLLAELIEPA